MEGKCLIPFQTIPPLSGSINGQVIFEVYVKEGRKVGVNRVPSPCGRPSVIFCRKPKLLIKVQYLELVDGNKS